MESEYYFKTNKSTLSGYSTPTGYHTYRAIAVGKKNLIQSSYTDFWHVNSDSNSWLQANGVNKVVITDGTMKKRTTVWDSVDLISTEDFIDTCEYRFLMDTDHTQTYLKSEDFWYYPTGVGKKNLIYQAHNGSVMHVDADEKTVFKNNKTSNIYRITRMEKRCDGTEITNYPTTAQTGTSGSGASQTS